MPEHNQLILSICDRVIKTTAHTGFSIKVHGWELHPLVHIVKVNVLQRLIVFFHVALILVIEIELRSWNLRLLFDLFILVFVDTNLGSLWFLCIFEIIELGHDIIYDSKW